MDRGPASPPVRSVAPRFEKLKVPALGTARLLVPMWTSALALLGVVGLYWYSIGPGEYRFPTLVAAALFAVGVAATAW